MTKSVFSSRYRCLTEALVSARRDAGLTQRELADRLSKPQSYVSKYERSERRLDIIEFLAIIKALDGDVADVTAIIERISGRDLD